MGIGSAPDVLAPELPCGSTLAPLVLNVCPDWEAGCAVAGTTRVVPPEVKVVLPRELDADGDAEDVAEPEVEPELAGNPLPEVEVAPLEPVTGLDGVWLGYGFSTGKAEKPREAEGLEGEDAEAAETAEEGEDASADEAVDVTEVVAAEEFAAPDVADPAPMVRTCVKVYGKDAGPPLPSWI